MKKTILFSAICLLAAIGVSADSVGQEKRMRVTLRAGHTYTFALEPGLCIHMENPGEYYPNEYRYKYKDITVVSGMDTLYSVADVAMLTYLGEFPAPTTGVKQVEEDVDLRLQEDGISVSGCKDKTVINVYAADGRQLFRGVAHNGTCFVPRNGLSKGVLIIKVNKKTIKLINR